MNEHQIVTWNVNVITTHVATQSMTVFTTRKRAREQIQALKRVLGKDKTAKVWMEKHTSLINRENNTIVLIEKVR